MDDGTPGPCRLERLDLSKLRAELRVRREAPSSSAHGPQSQSPQQGAGAGAGPRRGRARGPLVAKHPVTPTPSPPPELAPRRSSPAYAGAPVRARTPPPGVSGEGCRPRPCSPSLARSRPSSPSSTCSGSGGARRTASPGRRAPSPSALDPAVVEAIRRKCRRVQQARLYLLHQPGPNSFQVGGDLPEHKYRVVIGPQTCSCGRGPHCVHLLFVMLRVFQIPELDARIYAKELKNFEVESLFHNYRERLNMRVNNSMCLSSQDARNDSGPSSIGSNASSGFGSNSPSCANTQDSRMQPDGVMNACSDGTELQSSLAPSSNVRSEEDLCPICLLDMVDGESLVTCSNGCRNRLHHHCMAIWALECSNQGESVHCPLCRQVWLTWSGDIATAILPSPTQCHAPINPWTNAPHTNTPPHTSNTAHEKTVHVPFIDSNTSQYNHHQQNLRYHTAMTTPTKSTKRSSLGNCSHHMKVGLERRGSTGTGVSASGIGTTSQRCMSLSSSAMFVSSCLTEDVPLPHTEAIPPEQLGIAGEWIKVFGVDLVCCLYSRDWKAREIAFRRLKSDVSVGHLSDNEEYQQRVLSCCAKILAVFAADPVYKVYEAWVRCLQAMLNHARCWGPMGDLEELQRLVKPIIRALLLKCTDCNRRTSQLSIDVLLELAKGQEGELAIGTQYSVSPPGEGLNLNLVLGCILEDGVGEVTNSNWQWLAGRLVLLDRLLATFEHEFVSRSYSTSPTLGVGGQRLVSMLEFCASALRCTHVTVGRLARHLFVALVKMAMEVTHYLPLQRARLLLSGLEPTLQARLRKMLQHPVPQSPVCDSSQGRREASCTTPQILRKLSPLKADVSPARSSSLPPQHGPPSALPPKPSRIVPTSSPSRPRDLDLSRARTKRPVKFQLPGIGLTTGGTPSPVTPFTGGVSPKRCGPTHGQPQSGSRLYNLFVKKSKAEEVSVLPTKPDLNSACMTNSNASDISLPSSPDRRLPDDCCREVNFWTLVSKPATPTAPHCTPVRGDPSPQPQISAINSISTDSEMNEEVEVPIVFDDLLHSDDTAQCSVFNPQEKDMEGLKKEYNSTSKVEQWERYREGLDWIRGPLLGTGAFSACYQAWDITTGSIMAVKQVSFCRNSIEEQDRVECAVRQELNVLKTLRHQNIVRMLGATRQSTHFNMFVEWMAGGSVSGLLERYGPFSEHVILRYTQQVLCGLSYLHHKHILHRDLKGANLLVDSSGKHLRIGDLGTAAQLSAARTLSGEFQGQLLGTIAFMAPEVLRGEDYGRSCDIWSVGCCMIEMATTRPPWRESNASNHLALMYKIACSKDPPRMPDSLQGVARQLALDCLRVNSELRPSAKTLLQSYSLCGSEISICAEDISESNFDSGFYCYESGPEELSCGLAGVHIQTPVY